MEYKFKVEEKNYVIEIPLGMDEDNAFINCGNKKYKIKIFEEKGEIKKIYFDKKLYPVKFINGKDGYPDKIIFKGIMFDIKLKRVETLVYKSPEEKEKGEELVKAVIPGMIKDIYVTEGDIVRKGDILLIHEAMKMENEIFSSKKGRVKKVYVKEGDTVFTNQKLVLID